MTATSAAIRRFAVEEDGPDGERSFEIGEASFDEVVAFAGGKQLRGGEGTVVADQAVAAVEPLGLDIASWSRSSRACG
jgi:hypothetical protein